MDDTTEIDRKIADLVQDAEVVAALTKKLIDEKTSNAMSRQSSIRNMKDTRNAIPQYEIRQRNCRNKFRNGMETDG